MAEENCKVIYNKIFGANAKNDLLGRNTLAYWPRF
jgi:hypothetical protein